MLNAKSMKTKDGGRGGGLVPSMKFFLDLGPSLLLSFWPFSFIIFSTGLSHLEQ
jgi:hypothetical protein